MSQKLRPPYRVAVWGPGPMGKAAIREVLRLPETELVSVLAYNPKSEGIDVGELVGGVYKNTGVKVTTSMEKLIAIKPEVVIHTARDFTDFRCDDEIIKLLESGINVISVLPYQYPTARSKEINQKFVDAGKRGGAVLHGNGIDPGFLYERLAALMTGLSNNIQYIKLQEFVRLDSHGTDILVQFGFGSTLEQMAKNDDPPKHAGNYLTMGMHYLADKLGLPIEKIDLTLVPTVAPHDITTKQGLVVKKGTVAYLCYTWTGYHKGKPIFVVQTNWYMDDSVRPKEAMKPYYWAVEIEGIPSTRVGLEITGSIVRGETITELSPTSADYLATVIPAIQAIPHVLKAPPGVMELEMPQIHWKPDMRS